MKLGGMFQGLKGRGMLAKLAGKFDPYGCEVSWQCHIENTPTQVGLHHEAAVFSPHLQVAFNRTP